MLLELLHIFYTSIIPSHVDCPLQPNCPRCQDCRENQPCQPDLQVQEQEVDLQLLLRPLTVLKEEQKHAITLKKIKCHCNFRKVLTAEILWHWRTRSSNPPDTWTLMLIRYWHQGIICTAGPGRTLIFHTFRPAILGRGRQLRRGAPENVAQLSSDKTEQEPLQLTRMLISVTYHSFWKVASPAFGCMGAEVHISGNHGFLSLRGKSNTSYSFSLKHSEFI